MPPPKLVDSVVAAVIVVRSSNRNHVFETTGGRLREIDVIMPFIPWSTAIKLKIEYKQQAWEY